MISEMKNFYLRHRLLLLILVCCVACSQNRYKAIELTQAETTSTPEFIVGINVVADNNGSDRMCVEVSQAMLWKPGDYSTQLADHLSQNVQILVDSNSIPGNEVTVAQILTESLVFDDSGNVSGSHGGNMVFCFGVRILKEGTHLANIVIEATDGTQQAYTWEFSIIDVSEPRGIPDLPTLVSLPSLTP